MHFQVEHVADTLTPMLFFSSGGKAYKLKVWRLPLGTPTSRGKAFVNLLPIEPGMKVRQVFVAYKDALLAIQNGQNPRIIDSMLRNYLPEGKREVAET